VRERERGRKGKIITAIGNGKKREREESALLAPFLMKITDRTCKALLTGEGIIIAALCQRASDKESKQPAASYDV
jgi:hypothetical protein